MQASTKIKGAVVFDLDGTLSDTSGDIVYSANYIRKKEGLQPLDSHVVMSHVGYGASYLLSQLTGLEEKQTGHFQDLLKEYQLHYLMHQTEHSKLYPGIRELLQNLKRNGCHLYILSNKPHAAALEEVRGHDMESFFEATWGGGSLSAMKPDPVGILRAMELSSVPKDRVIMVGDMLPDLEVAKNAGVESCFVTWGFAKLKPEDLDSTHVVNSPSELEQVIYDLFMG